jgi:hypothetical protein
MKKLYLCIMVLLFAGCVLKQHEEKRVVHVIYQNGDTEDILVTVYLYEDGSWERPHLLNSCLGVPRGGYIRCGVREFKIVGNAK